MKKYIIWVILFTLVITLYQVVNVGNIVIHKWTYTIEKGDSISSIPKRFNIEVNSTLYKIWLKTTWTTNILKAWTFELNKDTTLSDLLEKSLNNPQAQDQEITILPGWNIFDIDDYLATKWIIKAWELISLSNNIPSLYKDKYTFLKWTSSLEWFLYPDTYRISLDARINNIAYILLDEFKLKIADKYRLSWTKLYNDMILASIVQKEERNKENQSIVAGILIKRLENNIAIGADATVCYSYKLTMNECTPVFIWTKIHTLSPYNTRKQLWLPPTPISNFTSDTFWAVNAPENSLYYYYLHDYEWLIHYAKTLDEHVRNKNLYLK